MNSVLAYLVKKGAHLKAVRISTTEIGNDRGMSQQNASRIVLGLEKEGKIRRSADGIHVSEYGLDEIRKEYYELKAALEGQGELVFSGAIVSGLGEGEYYIRKYSRLIEAKLGWQPYFGTLNIRLDEKGVHARAGLAAKKPIVVGGFGEQGRSYGSILIYPCTINGREGAVVAPERTHHGIDILEVITRKKLDFSGKGEGVVVKVR